MRVSKELYEKIRKICNLLKNKTNLHINYLEYIFALFYIKYSSNTFNDMFFELYSQRNNYYIANLIDDCLIKIQKMQEDSYIFSNITFKDIITYRDIGEESVLSIILENIYEITKNAIYSYKEIGEALDCILQENLEEREFVIDNREFYTPKCITNLMVKLVQKKETHTIYDPACGSGNFLISAYEHMGTEVEVYGKEKNISAYNICKTMFLLKGIDSKNIKFNDKFELDIEEYFKYDMVISNPPFSTRDIPKNSELKNIDFLNIHSLSLGGYTYVLEMLAQLKNNGNMAIILPHGVLFRNSERFIRKELIYGNYIKAIIGLPENLFFNTRLSVIILILSKEKDNTDILFMDASKKYKIGKNRKVYEIPNTNIEKILEAYNKKKEIEGFSYIASLKEIEANEYNLSIKKYVKREKQEIKINKVDVLEKVNHLEKEKDILDEHIKDVLEMLGRKDIVNVDLKNYSYDNNCVGKNIKNARIKKEMTQEQLAQKLNLSVAYIARIENGYGVMRLNTLVEICKILDTKIDDILFH